MRYSVVKHILANSRDVGDIGEEELARLFWRGEVVSLQRDDVIYKAGDGYDGTFFIVLNGMLRVVVRDRASPLYDKERILRDPVGSLIGVCACVQAASGSAGRATRTADVYVHSHGAQVLRFSMDVGTLKREFPTLFERMKDISWDTIVRDCMGE